MHEGSRIMAKRRTGRNGRVLRKGETYKKKEDIYIYRARDGQGHIRQVASKDLNVLR